MQYPTNFGSHTHKECANFNNGFCTLSGAIVDPNGPACPNFTPKTITTMPQPVNPQIQQTWRLPPYPQQPALYSAQRSYLPPSYIPYPWEMYGYNTLYPPFFTYLWNPYRYFSYWIMPWFNFPWEYMGYGYPAYDYEYQPYPLMFPSPFQVPPELLNEELAMLEAYKRELQAEIEEIEVRIRELKRWIGR